VSTQGVLWINELDLFKWNRLVPYFHLGVGMAINSARNFHLIGEPLDNTYRFPDNTVTRFAYEIGPGMSVQISPRLSISFAYIYSDFGSAQTKAGVRVESIVQTPLHPIRYGFRAHEERLSLIYVFS
jgi:opacity protein-like surface antigen